MPVVFIANKGEGYSKILSNMEEVKARKGKIIAIATEGDDGIGALADWVIHVPKTLDVFAPIINSIPLQLLAYHVADLKGLDVDKPRNLAKSVTVE
jgi:glucosamine--fructose-6-phosphate aminotransferase (isomerizing)